MLKWEIVACFLYKHNDNDSLVMLLVMPTLTGPEAKVTARGRRYDCNRQAEIILRPLHRFMSLFDFIQARKYIAYITLSREAPFWRYLHKVVVALFAASAV